MHVVFLFLSFLLPLSRQPRVGALREVGEPPDDLNGGGARVGGQGGAGATPEGDVCMWEIRVGEGGRDGRREGGRE